MDAVVLVAHGSRAPGTVEAHVELATALTDRLATAVYPAFLEISEPTIHAAIDAAVAAGARRIVVVPFMLLEGNHTRRDIPDLVDVARAGHPGIAIEVSAALGPDARLIDICADRARSVLRRPGGV